MLSKKLHASDEAVVAGPASTRSCLIETAKRVFARCGFEGASIRTLAEEAKTNVSAISYHFSGKEGLYRAVLEPVAEKMKHLAEQTLKRPTSAVDFRVRLEIFVESFFAFQTEEPETCQILQRDFPGSNEAANEVFIRSFLPIGEALEKFFEEALANGLFNPTISPDLAAATLMGSISGIGRFESTRVKMGQAPLLDKNSLTKTVQGIVANFCEGALKEERR